MPQPSDHPLDFWQRLRWDTEISWGKINARINEMAEDAAQEIQELTDKALKRNANARLRTVRMPILPMSDAAALIQAQVQAQALGMLQAQAQAQAMRQVEAQCGLNLRNNPQLLAGALGLWRN